MLSVLWPLLRTPQSLSRDAIDVAFYKDQLAAIDRDAARGPCRRPPTRKAPKRKPRGACSPRRKRRRNPSPRRAGPRVTPPSPPLLFVPAAALGLYAYVGHPDLPDLPLSARLNEPPGRMDLMAAIAKIEAHLAQNPE